MLSSDPSYFSGLASTSPGATASGGNNGKSACRVFSRTSAAPLREHVSIVVFGCLCRNICRTWTVRGPSGLQAMCDFNFLSGLSLEYAVRRGFKISSCMTSSLQRERMTNSVHECVSLPFTRGPFSFISSASNLKSVPRQIYAASPFLQLRNLVDDPEVVHGNGSFTPGPNLYAQNRCSPPRILASVRTLWKLVISARSTHPPLVMVWSTSAEATVVLLLPGGPRTDPQHVLAVVQGS